jgi:hypothetical protein
MIFRIDSNGGQIGRFWWDNSGQGGLFLRQGQFFTSFRPGRCGWRESWPDETACWPVSPWGKGDPADDYFRDFTAFESWFVCMMEKCNLDENAIDFTITHTTEMYSLFIGVFFAGVEAGQNPWRWAKDVEAKLLRQSVEPVDREVGP